MQSLRAPSKLAIPLQKESATRPSETSQQPQKKTSAKLLELFQVLFPQVSLLILAEIYFVVISEQFRVNFEVSFAVLLISGPKNSPHNGFDVFQKLKKLVPKKVSRAGVTMRVIFQKETILSKRLVSDETSKKKQILLKLKNRISISNKVFLGSLLLFPY